MKKIKFITIAIMVFLGLMLSAEFHVVQIFDNYENAFAHASYDFNGNWSDATKDIIDIAQRNEVIAFTYNQKSTSLLVSTNEVYTTKEFPEDIAKAFGINEIHLKSAFFGNVYVSVHDMETVIDLPSSVYLFLYGNDSNIRAFDSELSLIYPKTSTFFNASAKRPYNNLILLFWIGVIICMLFLTLVDTFFQKKEGFVRVTLGAHLSSLVIRNIVIDTLVYFAIFSCGFLVASQFTAIGNMKLLILLVFAILILLNSLMYLTLYKIDHKYAISKSALPKRILVFSYIIKTATVFATILAISFSISLLYSSQKYLKANTFFSMRDDYYYCSFQNKIDSNASNDEFIKSIRRNEAMNKEIYTKYFNECSPIILSGLNSLGQDSDVEMIYSNIHAYDYISSAISGFSMNNNGIHFIIPANLSTSKEDGLIELAKQIVTSPMNDENYSVYYYESDTEIIYIDSDRGLNKFKFASNPIIVFDATNPADSVGNISPYSGQIMYKMTSELQREIVREFGLESEIVEMTNVFEHYTYFWFMIKAGVYATLFISFLTLILVIVMVFRIIELEYTVNAIELSIKKILGYSLLQRNIDTITISIGSNLLCTMIILIFFTQFWSISFGAVAIASGIIFCIEGSALFYSIMRIEKMQITKILKGGAL